MTTTSDPVVPRSSAADLLREVEAVNATASRVEQALHEACLAAIRTVLRPGDVIDLRVRKGLPEYLWDVRTLSGNDRGTKLFRVAEAPTVRVNLGTPVMSYWVCEMVPVSETTGKDMSGASHGANRSGRTTVQLRGHLIDPQRSILIDDATGPSETERLVAFLNRASDPATPVG